jgi:superfamily II DNA or RNA helicase
MIFCGTAEHARDVAARLESSTTFFSPLDALTNTITASPGVPTALILGDTPRAERRAARERLARGEPLVLVGCGVFVEGWDSPEIRAVILARTFGFCGGYLQACGRGLRATPGKSHATIIDLSGASLLHGLPEDDRVWSLEGHAVRRSAEALKPLARCGACLAVMHAGPSECVRCGASMRGTRLPRRATRVERQELSRLDERPQKERDAVAIRIIEGRLRKCGRFPAFRIPAIARSILARSRRKAVAT